VLALPIGSGATTTRSNSAATARFRHPMHVRIGRAARAAGAGCPV
jgi:hypothetical protein